MTSLLINIELKEITMTIATKTEKREGNIMRSKVLVVLASSLLLGGAMISPALASGTGQSKRGGLTCNTTWKNTWGGVNCNGNSNSKQKWRMHVACAFQPDHVGTWHYGPGKDSYECNHSIQNADVEWG